MAKYTSVRRTEEGKLRYTYDKEQNHVYRRGSCISHKLAGTKRHSKVKGYEHNLTLEYLRLLWKEQGGLCKYSGRTLGNIGDGFDSPSIDRIDNSKGYLQGNVQWLCWGVNEMKKNYDEQFFFNLCSSIMERATTIPKGSTSQAIGDGSAEDPKGL